MKSLAAAAALAVAFAATLSPAFAARTSYVYDDAHLLSTSATAQINHQVSGFNAETGKEVVVVTTPSLAGVAADAALERSYAQLQVNGVEIFIAKNDKQIRIAGDTASRQFFPNGSFQTIYQAMRPSFTTTVPRSITRRLSSVTIFAPVSAIDPFGTSRGCVSDIFAVSVFSVSV